MVKRIWINLIMLILTSPLLAQDAIWASKVLAVSSEYDTKQYSSKQVLGRPNVLPSGGDNPCAWMPQREDTGKEYIMVGFTTMIRAQQLVIAENLNPGSVTEVILYDVSDKPHTVYSNASPTSSGSGPRMFQVKFPITAYTVKAAKVVLRTDLIPGYQGIDAIGIAGHTNPVTAKINVINNMQFSSKPENLGALINTRYNEIMPIISPDGKTLFIDRKDHPDNVGNDNNDDIYISFKDAANGWSRPINLGPPLNNGGHNFLCAITPDGNLALLGNVYEADGRMGAGVSFTMKTSIGWSAPQKLIIRDYYNYSKYSEYFLANDGKTLIMTIERDDSYGGRDIYVSTKQTDGSFSTPKNIGPIVNSAGTEMSPFLASDGKTLYFSSNGFSGYGDSDMFMTRRLDDTWLNWSEPQNLGAFINTPRWDAYYSVPASGDYAYFASETNSMGKSDIFRIKLPKEIKPEPVVLIIGKVLDNITKKPVSAKIHYEALKDGEELGLAMSDPVTGEFKIVLPKGEVYGFLASASGYLSLSENLDLTTLGEYSEKKINLYLVPFKEGQNIVLNNIFFKPSSALLSPESFPELDRIVKILKENPKMKIEISGHTNDGCSPEYCMKLSTERAKSVADYIIAKGITATRVTYKGYGSTKPVAPNDTPEGKKLNRRVEFTITDL